MGCDIHVYPEYASFEKEGGGSYWSPLTGRSNPGRDYDLFFKLAGVRRYGEGNQIIPTRGMPDDPGYHSRGDNELFITDDGNEEDCCSRADAERWVASGSSVYTNERKSSVSHPDWHSHSWCTPAEFRTVLEAPRPNGWTIDEPYWGLLAMLEEVERRGKSARLVFWFDN